MYNIEVELSENREPWVIPLNKRVQMVNCASASGKKIALMLYNKADTSTFRYRCYNVMQATERSETWQCVYFFVDELNTLIQQIGKASLLILARLKWNHGVDELIVRTRMLNIPVLFDIDDYVCDIDAVKIVTNTLNVSFENDYAYDFWFAEFSRLQKTASLADGFITTNEYLGERLSAKFGKPYAIISNSLNKEQLEVSQACLEQKNKAKPRDSFTIGYFSGTPSHINDFKVVAPELVCFLNKYPDTTLQVTGFMEFPASMRSLMSEGRVVFKPLVDFMQLQVEMAKVEVNIVPLVDNPFTNCKSELKYFEASAVCTPTLATPIYTYRTSIIQGETGYLCQSGEWYDAICKIYNGAVEPQKITETARAYCLNRYSGQQFVNMIENAYNSFAFV